MHTLFNHSLLNDKTGNSLKAFIWDPHQRSLTWVAKRNTHPQPPGLVLAKLKAIDAQLAWQPLEPERSGELLHMWEVMVVYACNFLAGDGSWKIPMFVATQWVSTAQSRDGGISKDLSRIKNCYIFLSSLLPQAAHTEGTRRHTSLPRKYVRQMGKECVLSWQHGGGTCVEKLEKIHRRSINLPCFWRVQ